MKAAPNKPARASRAHEKAREELEKREQTAELARVNDALREDAERLSAIIATQREIAGNAHEFTAVLSLIAQRTQDLTHASGAAIDLIEHNELVSRNATGIASQHVPVDVLECQPKRRTTQLERVLALEHVVAPASIL